MKLTAQNEEQALALRSAFHEREPFTLTGAGITAQFLATTLNRVPTYHSPARFETNVEFEQVSIAESVPATWNGPEDGLPPVGLEVERRFPCVAGSSWLPGTVIAKGAKKVFFRDAVGDEWAHGIEDVEFRPARTAEQLAAEAHRAKYMPQLIKLWDADTQRTDFLEAVYALIVEAGKP